MTPHLTCLMRIWIFLSLDNKWFLHQDSSLQHCFHPKLEDFANTFGEKDLQNNDFKLVSTSIMQFIWICTFKFVYIQHIYYVFRWMFCTTPIYHPVQYQKLCPPFVRMTKEPFFQRLFSTLQKKARAFLTRQMETCNQWMRLRRWFNLSFSK